MRTAESASLEWHISREPVGYLDAVAAMEARAHAIRDGGAREMVWLLEHPPLYTAGTSAKPDDLLTPQRFPVFKSGRGGQYTYHGPGQRVVYLMLDLNRRGADVRAYVCALENWIIDTLAMLGIKGEIRPERVGVWVRRGGVHTGALEEDKIAAIGIRLKRWVSLHGIALNVAPNLEHFSGIVPCGIKGPGVTSLAALGVNASMAEVDDALRVCFDKRLGSGLSAENRRPQKVERPAPGDRPGVLESN